ncbi:MAG: hypothetical protein AAGU14_02670 [Eubacteriaceae bacterium]
MENTFSADNTGALAGASDNTGTTDMQTSHSVTETTPQNTKNSGGFDSKEVQKTFSERLNKEREKIKTEISEQYKHHNTMFDTLKGLMGNENISPEELSEMLISQSQTYADDEYAAYENERMDYLEQIIESHPKMQWANDARERAEDVIREGIFKSDLDEIKSAFPEVKADSVFDLGDDFVALMQTGKVEPVAAYAACLQMQSLGKKEKPISMGGVKSSSAAEKDYYSPDEVDRLPKSAYDNPKVMDRIRRSMPKWNKS